MGALEVGGCGGRAIRASTGEDSATSGMSYSGKEEQPALLQARTW